MALNIQLDQLATLYPDTDTPFEDEVEEWRYSVSSMTTPASG